MFLMPKRRPSNSLYGELSSAAALRQTSKVRRASCKAHRVSDSYRCLWTVAYCLFSFDHPVRSRQHIGRNLSILDFGLPIFDYWRETSKEVRSSGLVLLAFNRK